MRRSFFFFHELGREGGREGGRGRVRAGERGGDDAICQR